MDEKLWTEVFSSSSAFNAIRFVNDIVSGGLEEGLCCDAVGLLAIARERQRLVEAFKIPVSIRKQALADII